MLTKFTDEMITAILCFVLAGLLIGLSGYVLFPFLGPLIMAGIVAVTIDPYYQNHIKKKPKHRRLIAVGYVGATLVIFIIPLLGVIYRSVLWINRLADKNSSDAESIQHLWERFQQTMATVEQKMALFSGADSGGGQSSAYLERALEAGGTQLIKISSLFFASIPDFILGLFIFCVGLYYILTEGGSVRAFILRTSFLTYSDTSAILDIVRSASRTILISSVIVGGIQATLVSLASAIFKIGDAFVVFVVTFILSFIPIGGAAPVALALASYAVIKTEYGGAVGLIVFALIAGTIDNIVRPYLVSGRDDLHPLLCLVAVLGGVWGFGVVGLFIGPIIVSTTVKAIPILFKPKET